MWVLYLLGMFATVGVLMLATGIVLAGFRVLWLKLGNPGAAVRSGPPRRGPGEGLYIEPPLHE